MVMYGGVSLACYINGVAQELYNLVRATAGVGLNPVSGDSLGLTGEGLGDTTRRVYRKLGQMLVRGETPKVAAADNPASPIRTRFRIDILSGSSAGGINAIFLAKGLANDREIDELTSYGSKKPTSTSCLTTTDRAGKERLRSSTGSTCIASCSPPSMGWIPAECTRRAVGLVECQRAGLVHHGHRYPGGVPLPLRLADKLVYEKRHKKVFHFRLFDGRDGRPAAE